MALVATVDSALQAVRLAYDMPVTGTVTITRAGPSHQSTTVRGWTDEPAAATQITARDFEAPLDVQVDYTVSAHNPAGALVDERTARVTITSAGCSDTWLNDLARVGNTMRIVIEALPELEYKIPAAVHDILTRRDPIVSSDIAQTPALELSFLTVDDDERERARAILGNGIPVLLRTPPTLGIGNMYLSVLAFREQRIVSAGAVTDRRFVVSGRQVTRPDPDLYAPVGFAIYEYVRDTFTDYDHMKDERASYDAVLYDWAGQTPSDIVPWPPDDL